ncbi:hypothetical protein [Kitasatospora griseola]|uniref:hypothetical protein n=1 Tax=Kitasatospora griseola TaxID=2064 RepID=UPI00380A8BBC
MRKIRTLAAAGVAAATLMLGVVAASPASAAQTCTTWHDGATFGISCSQLDGYRYVQAVAHCDNGNTVVGARAVVGNGSWSYAYCSSVNAGLSSWEAWGSN